MRPIIEESGLAIDTYLIRENVFSRLKEEFLKYDQLIVAYDYDNTVFSDDNDCNQVVELLQECSKLSKIRMIVYTARPVEEYDEVISYLDSRSIRHDHINENDNSVTHLMNDTSKILYNIFLDDKAGLDSAYETLVRFIDWYYKYNE